MVNNSYPKPGAALDDHEISQMFPMMSGEESAALTADIKKHGLREKVVLLDGKILDGRNRFASCREIGIEPDYRFYDYTKDGASPTAFVGSKNLQRRNLDQSQRAAIGVEIKARIETEEAARKSNVKAPAVPATGGDEHSQLNGSNPEDESQVPTKKGGKKKPAAPTPPPAPPEPTGHEGSATAQAAKIAGVSPSLIHKAEKLQKRSPKRFADVKAGKGTVSGELAELDARKEREALRVKREDAIQRIKTVCGNSLAEAVKEGTRLKTDKELFAFAACTDEQMVSIRGLIDSGTWSVAKALNYKMTSITQGHKVRDIITRWKAQGGEFSVTFADEGCEVIVRSIRAGEDTTASAAAKLNELDKK